eukprot:COSAG02_NODE_380_length_23483_cov_8.034382_6_plen_128_part_00
MAALRLQPWSRTPARSTERARIQVSGCARNASTRSGDESDAHVDGPARARAGHGAPHEVPSTPMHVFFLKKGEFLRSRGHDFFQTSRDRWDSELLLEIRHRMEFYTEIGTNSKYYSRSTQIGSLQDL